MTHHPTPSHPSHRARDNRRNNRRNNCRNNRHDKHRARPLHAIAMATTVCTACAAASLPALAAPPIDPGWTTVANSADAMPGSEERLFNSFNQPSVNRGGLVVMRARSKGGSQLGEPVRGIYARKLGAKAGPIVVLMDNRTTVPQPNNTEYQGALGTFTEFPAFPRIAADGDTVLTRAQSRPVWTYTLPDGSESRVGTSGIYAHQLGAPTTVMSQLGALPGFEVFSVPGAAPGTRFDQFPGAPANAGNLGLVFKGNYTDDGVPKTGVFYRSFAPGKAAQATELIASSDTLIPGQPEGGMNFGSTAPPSASNRDVVFLGLDNEQAPTLGGIHLAPLAPQPTLETLVTIGGPVPGEPEGTVFTRLGEALSFDGRFVGFWGGWGDAAQSVDPAAPAGASITALGLERDGLRGGWLAIAASMLDPVTSEAWAGVYARRLGK